MHQRENKRDVVRLVEPFRGLAHEIMHLLHVAGRWDIRIKALQAQLRYTQDRLKIPWRTVIANSVTQIGSLNVVQYDSTFSLNDSNVVV